MIKSASKNIKKTTIIASIIYALLTINQVSAIESDKTTDFNVNVKEVLSVSVTTPTVWATGDVDTFLRNKVSLNITSNNTAGFTASMTTKTTETALINTSKNTITLPTLANNTTRANFPANYWGFSVDDTEAGSSVSTYKALVGSNGTPITILSSTTASSGSKDFYFGAKANATQASGTYTGTVVISVVSGVIDNTNPITPVNPVTPNPTPNDPVYNPTTNVTSYTYNSNAPSAATTTTTTDVNSGDTRDVYKGYTAPQGVTYSTTARIANLSGLATGLGVVAAIATTSGLFFLFAARRDEDDEDSDQNF